MKPPPFDFVMARSIEAAVAALGEAGGEAKIIAGGQSLVPMLNFRLLRPSLLVDINGVAELSFIEETDTAVRIGALTRHRLVETSSVIAAHFPVITAAMAHVAHLAIRNRGTIGGSLAHADPAAELPMLALLLDAELLIASPGGRRPVAARDFFLGPLAVALADDELVVEIAVPRLPPATGWGFAEVARRHGDFALVAVAATVTAAGGVVREARIALTGIGDRPQRAAAAEALLAGKVPGPELLDRAAAAVCGAIAPATDLHASGDYRRHLAGVLTQRVLAAAWQRARVLAA